jgi:hypothetical protein
MAVVDPRNQPGYIALANAIKNTPPGQSTSTLWVVIAVICCSNGLLGKWSMMTGFN